MKEVLLVSDMVGVGKVALSAMIPILSVMKVNLNYLPTAMVSNNFAYGNADIHDMTDSMKNTVEIWKELDFSFDIITTGIVISKEQVEIIKDLIRSQKKKPIVIVDPIMGDDGTIYTGLNPDIVTSMKEMVPFSDILIPNATEAGLILGEDYVKGHMSEEKIKDWILKLRDKGAKSIAITSVKLGDDHYVYGYEDGRGFIKVKYEHIPLNFGGTGDIFSSLITGEIAKGKGLEEAIGYATKVLTQMIYEESKKEEREIMEIPVSQYLHLVK